MSQVDDFTYQQTGDGFGMDGMDGQAMGFDAFDTDGVEPEQESMVVDKEGYYHFEIQDVQAHPETCKDGNPNLPLSPHMLVICRVLQSVPGQSPEGSVYFHRMYLGGKGGGPADKHCVKAVTSFFVGIGFFKNQGGVAIDPETGSKKSDTNSWPSRLKGIQFIGHIKCSKSKDPQYSDKYELVMGKGAYQVTDPAVAEYPKSIEALKSAGYDPAQCGASVVGNQSQQVGQQPAQAPQTGQQEPQPQSGDSGGMSFEV